MLVKDFCKTLINLPLETAIDNIKSKNFRHNSYVWRENIFLPAIAKKNVIILLFNKNTNLIVDAFPNDPCQDKNEL